MFEREMRQTTYKNLSTDHKGKDLEDDQDYDEKSRSIRK